MARRTISLHPNKSVIATVNQLNRAAAFNNGKSLAGKPYLVLRIFGNE